MSSDDDLMLTAAELRAKQRKRRRMLVAGIGLVLAAIAILFGGRPTLNAVKAWQARRHADKAFALIAQEKWSDARGEAVAAYQLRPIEPQAVRAVARFLSRTRQPDALEFWKQLQDLQPLTREDLRDEAAIALAAGDMPRADDTVQKLIAAKPGPADWLLAAQLSIQKGAPENARASLETILNDPKANEREQYQAILFELATSQNQDQVNDAWARLEKISRGQSATSLDALVLLARRALSAKNVEAAVPAAESKPAAGDTPTPTPGKGENAQRPTPNAQRSDVEAAVPAADQKSDGGTGSVPSGELMGRHGGHPSKDNREPITADAIAAALQSHPLSKAPQKLLALDVRAALAVRAGQAAGSYPLSDKSSQEADGGTGSVPSGNDGNDAETAVPAAKSKSAAGDTPAPTPITSDLIAQAIAEFKDSDPDSLTALASWLNAKGEYQKTLDTIPLAKALQDKDLFLQHVDALGALGRWSEIKDLLDGERFPLDRVAQYMYLARCNAQLGEATASENNWKRALETAGGDVGKLLSLADYAEKNGNLVVAQQAYETAVTESPKLRPAQQGRLRMAQASRDTKKIHAVLADMLKLWPNDSAVQNDEAYLRLLMMAQPSQRSEGGSQTSDGGTGSVPSHYSTDTTERVPPSNNEELITIERLAQTLVQKEPASMPHRTLLALARLKQNRAAEALEVYSNIQVTANALTPSALAVHAAVLAANGKIDDAKTEVREIKIDNLVPEEKQLIDSLSSE